MYFQAIKNIMATLDLRAADIARAAQVSRAAISKWMRHGRADGWINVETSTLRELASALQFSPEIFLRPQRKLSDLAPRFLWDSLYHSIESFLIAVAEKRPDALARLVQVLGFHRAQHIAGDVVINAFPKYRQFIHPARRRDLESTWKLYR